MGYNLFKPLHTLFLLWCPSISILTLNPSFQTRIMTGDILKKCNLFLSLHRLYLTRQTNIKAKSSTLRLDRPLRLIQVRMQWCYLHLLLRSLKYRHPLPKDAYFLVQERVVRSADLVLRGISYILSSRRRVGTLSSTHIFDLFHNFRWARIFAFFFRLVPYTTHT